MKLIRLLTAVAVLTAACSGDGTTLREPGTGGATPFPVVVDTEPPVLFDDLDQGFSLRSPAFEPNTNLPARFTRVDGDDISPPLEWVNQPTDAVQLALVMTDPTAEGFVHWVIWGIDPTSTGIAEGQLPPGAVQALNSFGEIGYAGPAPLGENQHVYLFRLFALRDLPDEVVPDSDGRIAIEQLESHAMAIAELITSYP